MTFFYKFEVKYIDLSDFSVPFLKSDFTYK